MMNEPTKINGLMVDLKAIHELAHRCSDANCRSNKSCCAVFLVEVSEKEMTRLVGWMPLAARYSITLKDKDGYKNVFEEEDDGEYALDTTGQGYCVFSYFGSTGRPLCSLHSAALDEGENPADIKPACCIQWPIAFSATKLPVLTVHQDAYSFSCNRKRKAKSSRLNKGVAEIITSVWGEELVQAIEAEIEKRRLYAS